jgi:hypothetical protein
MRVKRRMDGGHLGALLETSPSMPERLNHASLTGPFDGATLEMLANYPGEILAFGLNGEGLLAHAPSFDQLVKLVADRHGSDCRFVTIDGCAVDR